MKKHILSVAFSFLAIVAVAQKKEIRNAEKAIEKGSYAEAKSFIDQAEASVSGAKQSVQADFYYTKAVAYLGNENNNNLEDLLTASKAMQKAKELGSKEAEQGLENTQIRLINSAVKDQNSQKFDEGATKLLTAYKMDERDTINLYYAANFLYRADKKDEALKHFITLKNLGYTGILTEYVATNKSTGEVEVMSSKNDRDVLVKTGDYTNPGVRQTPSQQGLIVKTIAQIYLEKDNIEEAKSVINEAKRQLPDDLEIRLIEADMHNRLGDMESYRKTMEEIIQKDSSNPTLFYNLGVSSSELGDTENAIKYYKRALELDPEMVNAQLNIASVILAKEREIVDQMNSLGTSKADNAKYEKLGEQRKQVYKEALPYLEAAYKTNPNNAEVVRTLMNIYYQVDNDKKAEEMKAKLDQLSE